ncbi:hypothetical protein [Comamonas thiooxydans]|uniref:hypothetical protein n=1 Tax=Comamonas thiooxydans TaxID=363952 RepID=UPI002448C5D8|nr:hypothetical protein [Comamonas thiooxydans]MDH1743784.1 hypothetical protein [Comamonas thiooxydans]
MGDLLPTDTLGNALKVLLQGLVTGNNAGITSTDTVLQALGKLQAQASAKVDKDGAKVLSDNNFTNAERVKLANVAENASANSSDSFLLNRANHTGTQDVGTLTGVLPIAKGGTGQTSKLGIVNDLKAAQQQHLNGSVTPVYLVAGKEYSLFTPTENPIYEGILPSSPNVGDTIVFHNGWGTWHAGRFTLSRGNTNHSINGLKESVTFNTDAVRKVTLTYVWGDIWRLYCEV